MEYKGYIYNHIKSANHLLGVFCLLLGGVFTSITKCCQIEKKNTKIHQKHLYLWHGIYLPDHLINKSIKCALSIIIHMFLVSHFVRRWTWFSEIKGWYNRRLSNSQTEVFLRAVNWGIAWVVLSPPKNYAYTTLPYSDKGKNISFKSIRRVCISQYYRWESLRTTAPIFHAAHKAVSVHTYFIVYWVSSFNGSMHNFFQVEHPSYLHLNLHLGILCMCMYILSPRSASEWENTIHSQKSLWRWRKQSMI